MTRKKSDYYAESLDRIRISIFLLALCLILLAIVYLPPSQSNNLDKINGIYLHNEDAYIRFNMSDQNQLAILNQIQAYCNMKKIDRCGMFDNGK